MSPKDAPSTELKGQERQKNAPREAALAQPKEQWRQDYERDYKYLSRLVGKIDARTKSAYLRELKKEFQALEKPDAAKKTPDITLLSTALENYEEFVELHEQISGVLKLDWGIAKNHPDIYAGWTVKFEKIDAEDYNPDFYRDLKALEKELIEADLLEEEEGGEEETGGSVQKERPIEPIPWQGKGVEKGGDDEGEGKDGESAEDGEQTAGGPDDGDEMPEKGQEDAQSELEKPKFADPKAAEMLDKFWDRVTTLPGKAQEVIYGRLKAMNNPDEEQVKAVRTDVARLNGIIGKFNDLILATNYIEQAGPKENILKALNGRFEIKGTELVDFKGLKSSTDIKNYFEQTSKFLGEKMAEAKKSMDAMGKMKLKAKEYMEKFPGLMTLIMLLSKIWPDLGKFLEEIFPEQFGNPEEKKNWEAQVKAVKDSIDDEKSGVKNAGKKSELSAKLEAIKKKGKTDGEKELTNLKTEIANFKVLEGRVAALQEPSFEGEKKDEQQKKFVEKLGKPYVDFKTEVDTLMSESKFAEVEPLLAKFDAAKAKALKDEPAAEPEKLEASQEGQKLASDFFDKLMNDLTSNELTILKDISVNEYISLGGEEEIDDKFDTGWNMLWVNNEKRIDQFKKAVIAFLEINGKEKAFLDKNISMKEFVGRIFSDKKRYDIFATLLKNSEHGFNVSKVDDFFKVIEINSPKTA